MTKAFLVRVRSQQRSHVHKDIYSCDRRQNYLKHLALLPDDKLAMETKARIDEYGNHPDQEDLAWREEACHDEWNFRGPCDRFSELVKEVIDFYLEKGSSGDLSVQYQFV